MLTEEEMELIGFLADLLDHVDRLERRLKEFGACIAS